MNNASAANESQRGMALRMLRSRFSAYQWGWPSPSEAGLGVVAAELVDFADLCACV